MYWLFIHLKKSMQHYGAGQALQKGKEGTESADEAELKKRAQTLRVTLEKLRLLAELVAKREKMKREEWKIRKQIFKHQVCCWRRDRALRTSIRAMRTTTVMILVAL